MGEWPLRNRGDFENSEKNKELRQKRLLQLKFSCRSKIRDTATKLITFIKRKYFSEISFLGKRSEKIDT
jgi:hypothetical protein